MSVGANFEDYIAGTMIHWCNLRQPDQSGNPEAHFVGYIVEIDHASDGASIKWEAVSEGVISNHDYIGDIINYPMVSDWLIYCDIIPTETEKLRLILKYS